MMGCDDVTEIKPQGFVNDCIFLRKGHCVYPPAKNKICQWTSVRTAPYWVDGFCNRGIHRSRIRCEGCSHYVVPDCDSEPIYECDRGMEFAYDCITAGYTHKEVVVLMPCPICGRTAEVIFNERWSVGCGLCHVFATDEDRKRAIDTWNRINSRDAELMTLKPCPFCGADYVNLDVKKDEDGDPYIYCYVCDSVYYNDNPSHDIVEMWNRRVDE